MSKIASGMGVTHFSMCCMGWLRPWHKYCPFCLARANDWRERRDLRRVGRLPVLFPRAHVLVLLPLRFYARLVRLPAVWPLGFWIVLQAIKSLVIRSRVGGIARGAHIGGFIAGAAMIPLVKRPDVRQFAPGHRRQLRVETRIMNQSVSGRRAQRLKYDVAVGSHGQPRARAAREVLPSRRHPGERQVLPTFRSR